MANLRMLEAAAAQKVRYYENDELLYRAGATLGLTQHCAIVIRNHDLIKLIGPKLKYTFTHMRVTGKIKAAVAAKMPQ